MSNYKRLGIIMKKTKARFLRKADRIGFGRVFEFLTDDLEIKDDVQIKLRDAHLLILEADKGFIGTWHYLGMAYFWNYEYRHHLRDAGSEVRLRVHDEFLTKNLKLNGQSDKHFSIIEKHLLESQERTLKEMGMGVAKNPAIVPLI